MKFDTYFILRATDIWESGLIIEGNFVLVIRGADIRGGGAYIRDFTVCLRKAEVKV